MPEERQRWISEEAMTVAPVVSLPSCSAGSCATPTRRRRSLDQRPGYGRQGSQREDGYCEDDDDDDDEDEDDDTSDSDEDSQDGGMSVDGVRGLHNKREREDGGEEGNGGVNGTAGALSEAERQQKKFVEGPITKEARLRRKLSKEERSRKRRRGRHRDYGDGAYGSNDGVPLTKEDKERQQRDFLRVLYSNLDYKPVILFFDRNA